MKIQLLIIFFTISFHAVVCGQATDAEITRKLKQEINKPNPSTDSVKQLLKLGADIHTRHKAGNTLLHFACQAADNELVKTLLDGGLNVNNADNKQHETPLHCITSLEYHKSKTHINERIEIVKLLLQKGADPNIKDAKRKTALLNECATGNLEIIKTLIAYGANHYFFDMDRWPHNQPLQPLIIAAKHNKVNIVKYFVEKDTFIYDMLAALNEAATAGSTEVTAFLLQKGIVTNDSIKNNSLYRFLANQGKAGQYENMKTGHIALGLAAFKGHCHIVNILIQHGVPVDPAKVEYDNTITALQYAVMSGNYDIVKLLIDNGADINRVVYHHYAEKTALAYAASFGQVEIAKLLINSRADLNLPVESSQKLIVLAAKSGNKEMVNLLLDSVSTVYGYTGNEAVSAAVNINNLEIARMILDRLKSWQKKYDIVSALITSLSRDYEEMFDLLLEKGIAVNFPDNFNAHPLYVAVSYNSLKYAEKLLKKGADINAIDQNGRTALDFARTPEMKKLLKSYGAKGKNKYRYKKRDLKFYTMHKDSSEADRKLRRELNKRDIYEIDLKLIKKYSDEGANVISSRQGQTGALTIAAARLDTALIKFLLQKGADVNETSGYDAPLTNAAGLFRLHQPRQVVDTLEYKRVEVARLLINNGADVNLKPKNGQTAIYAAVLLGNLPLVKFLVENGATIKSKHNTRILSAAVQSADIELLAYLLKKQKYWSKEKAMALITASQNGRTDMVKLLIENGANVNYFSNRYSAYPTALIQAAHLNYTEIAELLLKNGAKAEKPKKRSSAIFTAAMEGNADMVKLLVKYGGNVNKRRRFGTTYLHSAAYKGDTTMARILIDNGAEINAIDNNGTTPYGYAVNSKYNSGYFYRDMDKWLLKMGADSVVYYKPESGHFSIGSKNAGIGFGSFGKYNGIKFSFIEKDTAINGINVNVWGSKGEHEFHARINGLQAAVYTESDKINGIGLNVIGGYIEEINGLALTGGFLSSEGLAGINISGVGVNCGFLTGISLAPVNIMDHSIGLLAGIFNYTMSHDGLMLGGINFHAIHSHQEKYAKGAMIGVVNVVNGQAGLQLAIINYSRSYNAASAGLQAGILNLGDHDGVQFGLANINQFTRGLQIGLINYTKYNKAIQIGLLNINPGKKRFKAMPFINF